MPIYYARGVSVRLGAMPLTDTITPNIELRKGEVARKQCEEAEKKLLGSGLLQETRVSFPGDESGFELHWLGGAPFMQVRTGDHLFEEEFHDQPFFSGATEDPTHLRRLPAPNGHITRPLNNNDPLALSLHVKLSDITFISGMDRQNKVHLKIDTFFNGQLSSCLFVPPHDIRSGAKSLHQVFAGYRSDFLVERPWVILPPQKNADGSHRKNKSFRLPENRWEDICQALRREADARNTDKDGNIPPSAEFLKALATMQMPEQVISMQKANSRTFGVVDVVITAGDGRKVTSGAGYLKAPQRLMDENFPEPVVSAGAGEKAHSTNPDGVNDSESRQSPAPTKGYFDQGAEGESDYDYDYESTSKRQALVPHILSTVSAPTAVHSHFSRKLLRDALISSTPKTAPLMLQRSRTSDHMVSANPIASSQAKKGLEFLMSSTERGRTHRDHANLGRASYDTPRSLYCFPTSNITLAGTPQIRPSPYSLHYSDPVRAHQSSRNLMSQISSDSTSAQSSPLRGFAKGPDTPSQQCCPPGQRGEENMSDFEERRISAPMPTEWPELPRQSSMIVHHMPLAIPTVPWLLPPHLAPQPPGASELPGHVPNMLPVSTNFGRQGLPMFGGHTYPPAYDRQLSMPLPPTAMFSVPKKPRSSLSPSRKLQVDKPKKSQRSVLVKRLIIKGNHGATIVDHKWSTPPHIVISDGVSYAIRSAEHSPPHSLASSSSWIVPTAGSTACQKSSKTTVQADNEHLPCDDEKQDDYSASHTEAETSNARSRDLSASRDAEADSKQQMDAPATTAPSSLQEVKTKTNTVARLAVPQRRTPSGTNILGVQGPKATAFWFEDPEEILREAAKQRRAASPIKCSHRSSTPMERTTTEQVNTGLEFMKAGSSSPLSSVPTTPEPVAGLELNESSTPSFVPSKVEASESIPQSDGSPERAVVSTSLSKFTSSPMKLASSSTTRLVPKPQSTPQSSISPNTKKRKFQGRYLVKQPRSPDRLKTISNPPLNRNCVIAFAESEDKESERGVLRQVKGERQGVFAEEYVVYAARFFIAGN
jgi:hypothetical protein